MKKWSTEEFKKAVFDMFQNEYKVIGVYTGTDNPIQIEHSCGYKFTPTPNNLLHKKSSCPKCKGVMKKDTNIFKNEVFAQVGKEYTVIGEYISTNKKIEMRHEKCGNQYLVTPHNFLTGRRCPKCSIHPPVSLDTVKETIKNIYGDEYKVISDTYIKNSIKMKFQHTICGNIFESTYMNMKAKRNQHCPYCGKKFRTTEDFKNDVFNLTKDEYSVLGKFKTVDDHILIKHNFCGNEYLVAPKRFLCGDRCPKCSKSKGEDKLELELKKYNMNYITQYKFKDCKLQRPLTFDFYLQKYNILIEFDGQQHFELFQPGGTKEEYFNNIQRDDIKTIYALDNNIPLLRIPYTELNNIEKIIEKLNQFLIENSHFKYSDFSIFKHELNIKYPERQLFLK